MVERYYIKSSADQESLKIGLQWLLHSAKELGGEGIIAASQLSHLDGIIQNIMGQEIIDHLKKQYEVTISGIKISLITERHTGYSVNGKPILVIFPPPKFLDKVDSMSGLKVILVVPWFTDEITEWIKTRQAQEFGSKKSPERKPEIKNKVVENALQDIASFVRFGSGIHHPSDRDRVIETFKTLKEFSEDYNVDEIHTWLISVGNVKPDTANEIIEIAKGIQKGRIFHTRGSFWNRDNAIKRWRESAGKEPLTKVEIDEMSLPIERKRVESSHIHSIGYDDTHEILEVAFLSGGVYRYFDVPNTIHDELMSAESHGKYLLGTIRGKFRERRMR